MPFSFKSILTPSAEKFSWSLEKANLLRLSDAHRCGSLDVLPKTLVENWAVVRMPLFRSQ